MKEGEKMLEKYEYKILNIRRMGILERLFRVEPFAEYRATIEHKGKTLTTNVENPADKSTYGLDWEIRLAIDRKWYERKRKDNAARNLAGKQISI